MIGTGIQGIIIKGGSGGDSGFKSVNVQAIGDATFIQHNDLIGASEIINILSSEVGIINKNIDFSSITGRIQLNVFNGETLTINYKK